MNAQRSSGYARERDENYPTTPPWLASVIASYLRRAGVTDVWEPAAGGGALADALAGHGFAVCSTADDFLKEQAPPTTRAVDAIVTNPPYGNKRQGELACRFIRHALTLNVRVIAMLLRVDFDSGKTRTDLFRDNPRFKGKIVLLDRVEWFPRKGKNGPSDNHAWFIWGLHSGADPWIRYAGKP
jgi:hypothetical protein